MPAESLRFSLGQSVPGYPCEFVIESSKLIEIFIRFLKVLLQSISLKQDRFKGSFSPRWA